VSIDLNFWHKFHSHSDVVRYSVSATLTVNVSGKYSVSVTVEVVTNSYDVGVVVLVVVPTVFTLVDGVVDVTVVCKNEPKK
jgi:hypothetical protein